jgi:hypothetical protein
MSDAPADVMNSYLAGSNCYLKEPFNVEDFQELILSINRFSLTDGDGMRYPSS